MLVFNVNIKEPNRGIILNHSFIGAIISFPFAYYWTDFLTGHDLLPKKKKKQPLSQPPVSFFPSELWLSYLPALMFSLEKCAPQSLQSLPLLCFILFFCYYVLFLNKNENGCYFQNPVVMLSGSRDSPSVIIFLPGSSFVRRFLFSSYYCCLENWVHW